MVHGLMVAGPGIKLELARCWARKTVDPRRASWGLGSNVVHVRPVIWPVPQPKRLKRKFILRAGLPAFPVRRLRTVVPRGTGKSVDRE